MEKVKVLFLASNPLEQSRLALDEEARIITAQLRSADHRDAIELISAWAVRRDDLQQLLLQHKPQILHFSGHGTRCTPAEVTPPSPPMSGRDMNVSGKGRVVQLVLIGEGGQAEPMSEAALIHLFRVLKDNLRLVFLSACHSQSLAKALADVIPYTIGLSGAIADDAAIAFATAFYRALGFGRNLQEAFDLGTNALMNLQIPGDQGPRLYSRKDVLDPSKVVLIGGPVVPPAGANRNRSAMIEKVRTIWITGFLQQSLFHEVRILLGLSERPDAVSRPLDLLVKRPNEGERLLSSETQIVNVFDNMDRSLLILGAPGSGKTTLLLELARDLLDRAERDPTHPIPVVFPLSTWFASKKPLVDWLKDELNLRYDVPHKIAREWVDSDQVLPLLDGLDEVQAERRAECVTVINSFRQSHGFLPLVITSRTADYEALAESLRLHGAIVVRPLTREHVTAYLTDLGAAGEQIRVAIDEDWSLWELLDSPLLLNMVTVAYSGQRDSPLPRSRNVAERRNDLFGLYVKQMLQRGATESRYTMEETVHWLTWLALVMTRHGQTVFYLERLQTAWLPLRQRKTIRLWMKLVVGPVVGLVVGLAIGLGIGLGIGQDAGWGAGAGTGMLGGLTGLLIGLYVADDEDIHCVETVRWSPSALVSSGHPAGFLALLAGLGVGLAFGQSVARAVGRVAGLRVGLGMGLATGLGIGLFGAVTFGEIEIRTLPNEGIRRSAGIALFAGLFVGLAVGLVAGLLAGPRVGLLAGVGFGLLVGLVAGGAPVLKHVVLRLSLVRNRSTPWNYVRFLDHAAKRLLLRKVGGGYAFIHRMLLEYFAARYVETSKSGTSDPVTPPPAPR
jgi:hypothetical protein